MADGSPVTPPKYPDGTKPASTSYTRDVETVAAAIRDMPNGDGFPVNVRDDAEAIAEVAMAAAQELPRRAQVLRANRNG